MSAVMEGATMSTDAAGRPDNWSRPEQLRFGREVIATEAQALSGLAERLSDEFCQAVHLLLECRGNVMVTGMGKAGLIGQKITATLASTGTIAHFVHPAEAIHGDLGRIRRGDVVLALSMSGETAEVTRLIPSLAEAAVPLIAITGNPGSALGRAARVVLDLGPLKEACSLGLAPSTSTTAMLALGDALALVASRCRQFNRDDFARCHPGGSLGRKLSKVEDVMRPLAECRVCAETWTVREVLVRVSRPGRQRRLEWHLHGQRSGSHVGTESGSGAGSAHRPGHDASSHDGAGRPIAE
jgi:arabinose-5-phosphate isomerase